MTLYFPVSILSRFIVYCASRFRDSFGDSDRYKIFAAISWKYTLLQKKVYTLFLGEYSKCEWRRNPYRLEKLPIRVLHQLVLGLWQNSKWFQSSKEKVIGKSHQKVHKNLFLLLTSVLLADKAHAFKLCFTTLEPLWFFLQTQFCLDWNSNELSPIPCHGSYMA